jgi:DNA-binding Lrp family transcriptional regulator
VAALGSRGGLARPREVAAQLGITPEAARHRLRRLEKTGRVRRVGHGVFAASEDQLGDEANRIVAALRPLKGDAHLTGLDILGWRLHQHVTDLPRLMCVDPLAERDAVAALTAAGFDVADEARADDVARARTDGLVLIRRESALISHRRGVVDARANPEKAWFDLLRAIVQHSYPVAPFEAGRVLGICMRDQIINLEALERLIRNAGWTRRLGSLFKTGPADNDLVRALRAGLAEELG